MRTINAPDRDITFDVVDGLDSVMQRVAQRLRFRLGEWFLRTDRGTDYDPILGTFGINELGIQAFTAQGAAVEGVDSITDVRTTLNNETRTLRYQAAVHTQFGIGTLDMEI